MRVLHGILVLLFLCAGVPVMAAAETYALTGQFYYENQGNVGGVATDGAGNVYVTTDVNKVLKFSPSGTLLMTLGGTGPGYHGSGTDFGQFDNPLDVAVDGNGTIYVADSGNHRVQKFDAAGGFVAAWGGSGPGPGQFSVYLPGIGVDRHGNVFTVERDNNGYQRVQKFTSTGGFITSWDPSADATYVAIDSADQVYVSTSSGVRVYSTTGSFVRSLGAGTFMCGVTVDGADNVYAGEKSARRIRKFTSSGAEITQWGIAPGDAWGFPGPLDLAADSAGTVYALDDAADRVLQFSFLETGFTASPRAGYDPLSVQFTDTTAGGPTAWNWSFGDGQFSNARNPLHTYTGAGLYTVRLTVSNAAWSGKTATMTDYIRVLPLYGGLIRVQAEDYNVGGEGVGYHDTTAGNSGGAYRADDVDIAPFGTRGYVVTRIAEGEWARYPVWSGAAENYNYPLSLRLAGSAAGQTVTVAVAGMAGSIDVAVPETGSGDSYAFANATLRLEPGLNMIQFTYHGNAMNFDYFTLDPSGIPAPPVPGPVWTVPGAFGLPTCIGVAGKFDDVNGNERKDFADVVLYFNQMSWIAGNEPLEAFDYNGNGRIDFADVAWLFNNL